MKKQAKETTIAAHEYVYLTENKLAAFHRETRSGRAIASGGEYYTLGFARSPAEIRARRASSMQFFFADPRARTSDAYVYMLLYARYPAREFRVAAIAVNNFAGRNFARPPSTTVPSAVAAVTTRSPEMQPHLLELSVARRRCSRAARRPRDSQAAALFSRKPLGDGETRAL